YNVYSLSTALREPAALAGQAGAELPLVVLTSRQLPPSAARLAAALRARQRALLVGSDVVVAVAESVALPVGDATVLVRDRRLLLDGAPLPDVLAADVRATDAEAALAELAGNELPAATPVEGAASRAPIATRSPFDE